MSRVTRPALRGTLLGSVLRVLNPLVRRLLASRLHRPLSRWLALLRWTRPDTGRSRTTPLSYIREGGLTYVTTGDRWAADLRAGAPVAIRLGGRWYDGMASVVDQEEASPILLRLFHGHSWFRALSGIPRGPDGGADPRAVDRALASGRVLVRISLRTGGSEERSAPSST